MALQRKFLPSTTKSEGLGERQIRVIVSTPDVDRVGDIVVADGIDLVAYKGNPIVLWNHDAGCPVARCVEISARNGALEALVQFPPEGDDVDSDRLYRRIKNGIVNATSIGFNPTKAEPLKQGGVKYAACELMEFSFVSVPANPEALVVERSLPGATAKTVKPLKVKSLYDVANLADLLSSLGYLEACAEWEAEYEGDDSPVPAMLTEALRQLGAALIAMTVEEVGELLGEEGGAENKAAALAKVKTFRQIVKAGRALSEANESDIKAACELMETASGKLTGILDRVAKDAEDETDDADEFETPEEKALQLEHFRCKAALAALTAPAV